MVFQQLIKQQGFLALKNHNAKINKKTGRSPLHNICCIKRVFSIKKKEIFLRVTKTANRCSINIFLKISCCLWSRTHIESFPHCDSFHNTMRLKNGSFKVAVFRCIMAIWKGHNAETVRNIILITLPNRIFFKNCNITGFFLPCHLDYPLIIIFKFKILVTSDLWPQIQTLRTILLIYFLINTKCFFLIRVKTEYSILSFFLTLSD